MCHAPMSHWLEYVPDAYELASVMPYVGQLQLRFKKVAVDAAKA